MPDFLESPRFPVDISFGAQGGPGYNTAITTVRSGRESRLARWVDSRAKYDVSYGVRTQKQLDALIAFFRTVRGQAIGFRLKDWADYRDISITGGATSVGILGATGIGTGYPTYQLVKKYINGSLTDLRTISKPTSILSILKNAILQTLTTHYTGDSTTGIVTFVATSSKAITGITQANPGVVSSTAHGFTNGQIIYISGVVGMTQVNNLAFTIAGVSANAFDIGVNTTAYTAYSSGGTAALYPQPADVLTWAGEYDVPVRFDIDQMQYQILDKAPNGDLVLSWQGVPLVEVRI